MTDADGDDIDDGKLLDLEGCAALLRVRPWRLRRWVRRGKFIEPSGQDGAPFWERAAVWR